VFTDKPQNYHLNSALLIIYNKKLDFLMQIRSKDAPIMPSFIGFFGGGMEDGESPYEAAIRESKEELEVLLDYKFYKERVAIVEGKYRELAYFYIAEIDNKMFTVNEGDGFYWLNIKKDLRDLKIQEHDLNTLKEAYHFLTKKDINKTKG
jgi:8-oxo-dGTP pyrophosphatase MutT (NUDIX family)